VGFNKESFHPKNGVTVNEKRKRVEGLKIGKRA